MGDVLRGVALENPSCQLTVLCGHTHGTGQARVLPNLITYTKGAEYGRPEFVLLDLDQNDFALSAHEWTERPA